MKARFVRPLLVAALGAAAAGQGLGGCTSSGLAGLGEECAVATDCAPGLVCVVQKSGGRVCSDDLSGVLGKPPASTNDGADGGDVADDGGADASTVEPDASPGDVDAGSPDAASPEDAGQPEPDAGQPEPDAGSPEDAGGETPDADG